MIGILPRRLATKIGGSTMLLGIHSPNFQTSKYLLLLLILKMTRYRRWIVSILYMNYECEAFKKSVVNK